MLARPVPRPTSRRRELNKFPTSRGPFVGNRNPSSNAGSATYGWNDLNNDRTVFNPDFTLQLNELGPSTNQNFGRSVQTTTVNPEILDGWGHRPYIFEVDLGVQHQLASRASTTAMFYHRWSGNHFAIAR